MNTFRSRLTFALAISTAAFVSVFCVLLYFWCQHAFLVDLDGDLASIVRAELSSADPDIESYLHLGAKGSGEEPPEYEIFGLILDRQGKIQKSTENLAEPPRIPSEVLERMFMGGSTFGTLQLGGERFRYLGSPVSLGGKTYVEVLGISQHPMEERLQELRNVLVLSWIVGIGLLALTSNLVARYLIGPLENILDQIETVAVLGDPGLRVEGDFQDKEISALQGQTNAMLERLDSRFSAQRRLVADASHELRAPLSNLSLAIEVCLRRDRDETEYREVLRTCHGETQRLTNLANGLLTLSKADAKALHLDRFVQPFEALVQSCAERHKARAVLAEVELVLTLSPGPSNVDGLRMSQVLDNLVGNALRYAPPKSQVDLTLASDSEGLEFRVTDRGPGLDQAQCRQVFERFYRVDASRHRETGGAGLGLAIAHSVIEAHGGKIGVRSIPHVETTFWFWLPLAVEETIL